MGSPTGRRTVCVLVALLLTPVGIWFSVEGGLGVADALDSDDGIDPVYLGQMLIGLLLLLLIAASARFSRAGAFVGALVWGVGPVVVHSVAGDTFTSVIEQFDEAFGDWLDAFALVVFPMVAALLLGAALAGRGRRPTSTR
jgi:hypothetical protein